MKKFKYAIEVGGGYTNIYIKGQGLALKEPTLVAAEPTEDGYKVIALGSEARKLVGKTKENIETFTPCIYGEHSNYEYSVVLLKYFLSKVGYKEYEDDVLFLTPCGLTAREKENILRACEGANMGYVELIPAIICSCVGEGRKIDGSTVNMVVDIGGAYTDIAVINMSNIIKGATLSVGGKSIDASIVNYMAYSEELLIGLPTAETLKNEVGSLFDNDMLNMEVTGVDVKTKSPKTMIIYSENLKSAIRPFYDEIIKGIETTINTLPPEIVTDIINNKILITGGAAKMQGLENYLKKHLNYPVQLASDMDYATILGAGKLLSDHLLLSGIINKL